MILPDVNVLVHAFRADSSDHAVCADWLSRVVNSDSQYGISLQVLSGFIRIATHPKIFIQPSPLLETVRFCEILISQPQCVIVQPGPRHWDVFTRLCVDSDVRGNLVADAWFAALAIESGSQWITLDRDYARFKGLNWGLPSRSR